jgi:dipeptide transport system ATP-binding protein
MLLEVENLSIDFKTKKGTLQAVRDISFSLERGETLGVVGESGCGKSTLAKTLMGLVQPTEGEIDFLGVPRKELSRKECFETIQMIFQDPYSSLNPRKQAWRLISEPLLINSTLSKKECFNRACELMERVGLRAEYAHRYPHMFSGGQRQRLGIARALVMNPKILICDEPVSALDVSIQAQVLNTLMELQDELDLTYIFISHDLNVVHHISDQLMVMYLGKIVEQGPRNEIFENPKHPYTKALFEASPNIFEGDKTHKPLEGELPSPLNPPTGCAFHERCPMVTEECKRKTPPLELREGRYYACFNN